jgi:hypothetical protein
MARKGRCQCGNVLRVHRSSQGYKTRCPVCGSVVRLSAAGASDTPGIQESSDTPVQPLDLPPVYIADGGDVFDPQLPIIEMEPWPGLGQAERKDSGSS